MKTLQEKHLQSKRMQDILLLLEHLVRQEEATAKTILNCLYDIGSINLINKKIPQRPLNRASKSIARISKPVFSIIALRWFQKNSPKLIASWLYSQVSFEEPVEVQATEYIQENTPIESELPNREIKRLRSQVRLLAGTSVVAIAAFASSMMLWLNANPGAELARPQLSLDNTLGQNLESLTKDNR